MRRASWRTGGLRTEDFVLIAVALVACSSAAPTAKEERVCTPGAYVFCRCQDRSEGTKLCIEDGTSFEKCECANQGTELPPLSPTGDAGFEEVDTGPPPTDPDLTINAQCAGKLAVLASSEDDFFLFAAAYGGKGQWTVAKSQGPALRSVPRGGLVDNSLIAIWRTRYNLIAWTKFQANQTTLSPPVSVGFAVTSARADFTGLGSKGALYYVSTDDKVDEGIYSPSSAWNDATTEVASNTPGKSAPSVAVVGTKTVIVYSGTDGTLSTQSKSSSSSAWSAPTAITGAAAYEETPALTQLVGASEDLMIVYVGSDLILHSVSRDSANAKWQAPIVVDTSATADGAPSVAPMSKGRALAAWKGTNGAPFYSLYDPSKNPRWSAPAGYFPKKGGISVVSPPAVNAGRCGSEVTTTYVDKDGNVNLALFVGSDWLGPYQVPGMTKMTFAGAGEVP